MLSYPLFIVLTMGFVSVCNCYINPISTSFYTINRNKRIFNTNEGGGKKLHSQKQKSSNSRLFVSSSSSENSNNNELDIEYIFSKWYNEYPKSTRDPYIFHSLFGTLRGMEWNGNMGEIPSKRRVIANIPRSMVLQSNNYNNDWDVQLTKKLWNEYILKESSTIYGYCQLLLNSNRNNDVTKQQQPIFDYKNYMNTKNSVSPNALRHWDNNSKSILNETMVGKKLLEIENIQKEKWDQKYENYLLGMEKSIMTNKDNIMSYEQFIWIMEVVHSRAFSGNFGSTQSDETNPLVVVAKDSLFPIIAAIGGIIASQQSLSLEPSIPVLIGFGIVAIIPLVLQIINDGSNNESEGEKGKSAVLLPLIDSANHMEEADSSIQYDPISNAFQLSVGPNCLVTDNNDMKRTQLFISYGKKKDSELLLNYGFLANVPCSDGNDDEARKNQRIALATEYITRNR